jgi:ferredoxin
MIAGKGDLLPVSALPIDGTFPTGTTQFEKRALAAQIPIWEPDLCIDCGKCAIVCPHAAIRMKVYEPVRPLRRAGRLPHQVVPVTRARRFSLTVQVAPDDCTGCGICVDVCPAKDKSEVKRKSINMRDIDDHRDVERARWDVFTRIPELDRTAVSHDTVKNSQLLQPLFEFSGACSGCGETPYIKLLTQLFGDRLVIANATGCSSIYGGNLPTTPYSKNGEGIGPAWSNSLFEDNAEFGLGIRLGIEHHQHEAARLVDELAGPIGPELATALLANAQPTESDVIAQRRRVAELRERLTTIDDVRARRLESIADELVRTARGSSVATVGVRHRLRRCRSRAQQRPQRQPAGARHRGLLEHRRAGIEVDAARSGREVRDRRQGDREEGPRCGGAELRQRVRRADRTRRQRGPDVEGAPRGRRMGRAVAHHRLLDLHRPRHRHDDVDGPPEGRGEVGLLAAVPVQAVGRGARAPVPARLGSTHDPACVSSRSKRPGTRCSLAPIRHVPNGSSTSPSRRSTSAGATTSSSPRSNERSRTSTTRTR